MTLCVQLWGISERSQQGNAVISIRRLPKVLPTLIEFIAKRFLELDDDDSGYLTIEEITGGKYYLKNGNICSKKGDVLGVKGLRQFSNSRLEVDLSDDSENDEKGGVSDQA